MQHPDLAEPTSGAAASPDVSIRYRTFVASLLTAGDEILALEPTEGWRATLSRHLAPHQAYLGTASARDTVLADCSEAMRALVHTSNG